jgi:hypothetical protein
VITELSPKTPEEIVAITMDFSSVMSDIASATWIICEFQGHDAYVDDMLVGVAYGSGAITQHLIQKGLNNYTYLIKVVAFGGQGEIYNGYAYLPVRAEDVQTPMLGALQSKATLTGQTS